MACNFTDMQPMDTTTVYSKEELQSALNTAGTLPNIMYEIVIGGPIDELEQSLVVPYGAKVWIRGEDDVQHMISAAEKGFSVITIDNNHPEPEVQRKDTILRLSHLIIHGGVISGHGGGISAEGESHCEIVVGDGVLLTLNSASAGGGIYNNASTGGVKIEYGAFLELNIASEAGGAVWARCIHMVGGVVDNNETRGGTGLLQNGGGAFYGENITIDGGTITSNISSTSGGGIGMSRVNLANLKIAAGVTFDSNEAAEPAILDLFPQDVEMYNNNILSSVWTNSMQYGFNNIDISYSEPAVACPAVGSRMVDINQPVRVRPFARVGTVRSRCCGPVRQIPGIDPSPSVLDNCDFTIHQNICVQVPVEFGANVEVLDATSTCQGDCENCDKPIDV